MTPLINLPKRSDKVQITALTDPALHMYVTDVRVFDASNNSFLVALGSGEVDQTGGPHQAWIGYRSGRWVLVDKNEARDDLGVDFVEGDIFDGSPSLEEQRTHTKAVSKRKKR